MGELRGVSRLLKIVSSQTVRKRLISWIRLAVDLEGHCVQDTWITILRLDGDLRLRIARKRLIGQDLMCL